MLFACLYIPDFPVEAIVRVEPELREQAVAVVEGRPPLFRVVSANERARQVGIEIGMTQVQAQGYAPGLQLRKRSPLQENAAHAALMDCACAVSPRVYGEQDDTVLLDIGGLERLFGPPAKIARELARRAGELGMEANVGVAANVETAIHAARGFPGTTVIPRGREAERLASLPVEALFDARAEHAQEMLETLERWGVRTFRALALLPEVALAQRLGEAGVHLRKLARGEGSRPLVPAEAPLEFEEAVELEDAIEMLEPLLFVLNRMLDQLCARLATRSLAAQELHLRLELDPQEDIEIARSADEGIGRSEKQNLPRRRGDTEEIGPSDHRLIGSPEERAKAKSEIRNQNSEIEIDDAGKFAKHCLKFPVPMLDVRVFLKLLQLELRARPPQAPVMKIWLRAEPAQPRPTQGGLFLPTAPEPEKLEVTLARIASVVQEPLRRGSTRIDADSEKVPAPNRQQAETPHPPQRNRGTEEIGSSQIGGSEDRGIRRLKTESADHANTQAVDALRVGCAEVLDTHRPDAFRVKRFSGQQRAVGQRKTFRRGSTRMNADFKEEIGHLNSEIEIPVSPFFEGGHLALRRFRPLVAARVRVEGGRPVWLQASEDEGAKHGGAIVWASGPWRTSGEWWNEQPWARDVWDVAVVGETVTVYRIFCERGEWWMEGSYD